MSAAARLFDPRPCELGEGALWHPTRQQIFWFDILGRRLMSRQHGEALSWRFDECVSAAGWVDAGTLLIASETGLWRFDVDTGARSLLAPLEADSPATRSNDGRADPFGGFWIGTMGKAAEPGAGAIYRFYRGELRQLHAGLSIPNSICFAPDGGTAYFADTARRQVMRQRLDAEGWPQGGAEPFLDLRAQGLNPDGAVTDAEGGIWIALWGAGRVARFTAQGRHDRDIAVPGRQTTCPAFGGGDFSALYVTTAREGLADPGPAEGATYLADPGATGLAEPRVLL